MASPTANRRGILALCGAMVAYTVNDAMVKGIALRYPVGEVLVVRGICTILLVGAVVVALGHAGSVRQVGGRPIVVRSFFDGLSTACFVIALVHMKLADLAAVLQISPLILAGLSVLFYRETVGWRRMSAIVVGFIGAMFVVKPTPSAFDIWALVGLLAAASSALRETQTRQIDPRMPTIVITFVGTIAILLVALVFAATETWQPMAWSDVAILGCAAVFVGIATYLTTLAFRGVDLSVVGPFRYSYLPTSAIAGYLVFGEVPDAWSGVGALLIVASGLYALHREAVRRKELTAKITPAA